MNFIVSLIISIVVFRMIVSPFIDGLNNKNSKKVFLKSILFILFFSLLMSLSNTNNEEITNKVDTNLSSERDLEFERISDSKLAITERMKDPSSVEFRDVYFIQDSGAVCGEVNAKNSFGGYAGYKNFIYVAGMGAMLEEDFKNNEFAKTWNKVCVAQKIKGDKK